MEHRGHADHRTLFPREEAGGRGRDRSCEPHGDGLRLAQHRPAKCPGQGAQTRPGRNHDLLARNRGNDLVRDGTAGRRHGARPHGAVAAPRRADRRHGAHHAVRRMGAHRMARGRRSERHRNGLRLPPQGRHGVARGTRRRDRGRNLPRETRRPRPRNDLRTESLLRHGPQRHAGIHHRSGSAAAQRRIRDVEHRPQRHPLPLRRRRAAGRAVLGFGQSRFDDAQKTRHHQRKKTRVRVRRANTAHSSNRSTSPSSASASSPPETSSPATTPKRRAPTAS